MQKEARVKDEEEIEVKADGKERQKQKCKGTWKQQCK
jgi:hypothetical protein